MNHFRVTCQYRPEYFFRIYLANLLWLIYRIKKCGNNEWDTCIKGNIPCKTKGHFIRCLLIPLSKIVLIILLYFRWSICLDSSPQVIADNWAEGVNDRDDLDCIDVTDLDWTDADIGLFCGTPRVASFEYSFHLTEIRLYYCILKCSLRNIYVGWMF